MTDHWKCGHERTPGRMPRERIDEFAELLSLEMPIKHIRAAMNLTRGETASTMRKIRKELGWQADE